MRSLIGYLLDGLSSLGNSLVDVLVSGFVRVRSFLTKGGETMERVMKSFGGLQIRVLNPLMAFVLAFGFVFGMVLPDAYGRDEWQIEIVDSEGQVGEFTSLALGSNGYPHISYYDSTNAKLKYAYWDGVVWQIQTVDSGGEVGSWTSLALDSNGYPHVSYHDDTNANLKYAYWDGVGWQIQTVDSGGEVGECTSLALDSNDYPHISYLDLTNENLKYAYWDGTEWQIETADSGGRVGYLLYLPCVGQQRLSPYQSL